MPSIHSTRRVSAIKALVASACKQIVLVPMLLIGAAIIPTVAAAQTDPLVVVAEERHAIWNGVTVSPAGRVFVNYPPISPRPMPGVAEIQRDGTAHPFPGGQWNSWTHGASVAKRFVGTNSVRIGPEGDLWIVDTGTPSFGAEVLPGAAKIVRINLSTNRVVRIYPLDENAAHRMSYVDDIRFHGKLAYLTDAGDPAIIILDLASGRTRRVLEHDRSTTAVSPVSVDGEVLRGPNRKPVFIHADQMEVSPDGKWLYFQPLSGPLYRVETKLIDDPSITGSALSAHVELWHQTGSLGGTAIDREGNVYLEDMSSDSIVRLNPVGESMVILQDHRLHWADAPWIHDGWLYLPVTQIDRAQQFNGGKDAIAWPLFLYKYQLPN